MNQKQAKKFRRTIQKKAAEKADEYAKAAAAELAVSKWQKHFTHVVMQRDIARIAAVFFALTTAGAIVWRVVV
jgi:hypothetical protein